MLIIGNGESRQSIDLNKINMPKIGCNAVFRDCYTEHLVCVDRPMVKEAVEFGATQDRTVYTRSDWNQRFSVESVPNLPYQGTTKADHPFNWGSGPYAVLLGATLSSTVGLLGFDLYSVNSKINNVYKGSKNYKNSDHSAVDPRYWIYQIAQVVEHFPQTQFTIFQTDNWQLPHSWKKSNVTVDRISNI
jgi:hypothetical protein